MSFSSENELEAVLIKAKDGSGGFDSLMDELIASALYVPSAAEVSMDLSGFMPLLYERENGTFVSVFTSQSRLSRVADVAEYHIKIQGSDFFSRMPPGYGVVINPRWSVGCEIDSGAVDAHLRR